MQAIERGIGDNGLIKGGGLAWLLWQEGAVVIDVVDHSGTVSSLSPGIYRREVTEGEHNK